MRSLLGSELWGGPLEWAITAALLVVPTILLAVRVARDKRSPREIPRPGVDASDRAVEFVRDHGNQLYVWEAAVARDLSMLQAATERPEGVEFVKAEAFAAFQLYVQAGLDPAWLELRRERFPHDGVVARSNLGR